MISSLPAHRFGRPPGFFMVLTIFLLSACDFEDDGTSVPVLIGALLPFPGTASMFSNAMARTVE